MDLLNQQTAAQEKWFKETQQNGPKNNHMAKNEIEIGKYSLRYKALCVKNDKRDKVGL